MMMTRPISLALLVLAASLAPEDLSGQAAGDAIPRDVVMAILRNAEGPEEPRILVGNQLPPDLAALVSLPSGARVIATVMGRETRVIGAVTGSADSVRLWFANEFERRGYQSPQSRSGTEAFRPAERTVSGSGYCAGGRLLTVSAHTRPAGQVEFVVASRRDTPCSPQRPPSGTLMTSGSSSGYELPILPLLYHPRGAEVSSPCRNALRGSSQQTTEATVATSSNAEQLMAHYGAQLQSAGWTRQPVGGTVTAWARRDSTGRQFHLSLAVESGPGGPDCRYLRMSANASYP
jgi:hypothetical protein